MQKEPAASLLQLNMTSFALGNFDLKWGNSYDALNHFEDAIAWTSKDEVSDSDLPEMLLKTTLLNLYQLEFNARLFQNALQTHELMEGKNVQDILRSIKPYQKEIERLKKQFKKSPLSTTGGMILEIVAAAFVSKIVEYVDFYKNTY